MGRTRRDEVPYNLLRTDFRANDKRAWQDSNLRHTAPETVALSPELQARAKGRPPGNVTVRRVPLQRSCGSDCR
jgi:hypothetical protein